MHREKPTYWEFRVFIAVAENRTYDAAARQLTEARDTYSRQSVGRAIRKVQSWVNQTLLQRKANGSYSLTAAGEEFLVAARQVVALYERIGSSTVQPTVWTLACAPHHTQFVTLAADWLRERNGGDDKIQVEYLERTDRGEHQFQGEPVDRLLRKELRLIIGPSVANPALRSIELYQAQLEVMIDRRYRAAELQLADLVTRYEALLQPQDIRARRMLEEAIRRSEVVDPGSVRIAMETTEAGASVMRLRTERPRRGGRDRVMVLPSDVAQPFKDGMEFGGSGADRFRWVPVHDATGALRLPTYVTIRKDDANVLRPVIEALRFGVARLEAARHPISGGPVASPTKALPVQRPSRSD
ncbi:LysR family transcriptional regulator [Asanoa sp. WMMD1127]|uniref:LysR family transcriptional regulator n=1 Tax=Asanoa sp. WMMD1127 TaxID=3016107 RepID=UPI0024166823|nr:LysR family transcriptional regulator [Asanoa sp. WMMD1127]MDG4820404.1 LysR family transcriptional regulator [Asanoa sp. WMMD1127]